MPTPKVIVDNIGINELFRKDMHSLDPLRAARKCTHTLDLTIYSEEDIKDLKSERQQFEESQKRSLFEEELEK